MDRRKPVSVLRETLPGESRGGVLSQVLKGLRGLSVEDAGPVRPVPMSWLVRSVSDGQVVDGTFVLDMGRYGEVMGLDLGLAVGESMGWGVDGAEW